MELVYVAVITILNNIWLHAACQNLRQNIMAYSYRTTRSISNDDNKYNNLININKSLAEKINTKLTLAVFH